LDKRKLKTNVNLTCGLKDQKISKNINNDNKKIIINDLKRKLKIKIKRRLKNKIKVKNKK